MYLCANMLKTYIVIFNAGWWLSCKYLLDVAATFRPRPTCWDRGTSTLKETLRKLHWTARLVLHFNIVSKVVKHLLEILTYSTIYSGHIFKPCISQTISLFLQFGLVKWYPINNGHTIIVVTPWPPRGMIRYFMFFCGSAIGFSMLVSSGYWRMVKVLII